MVPGGPVRMASGRRPSPGGRCARRPASAMGGSSPSPLAVVAARLRRGQLVGDLYDTTWPSLAARRDLSPQTRHWGERLVRSVVEAECVVAMAGCRVPASDIGFKLFVPIVRLAEPRIISSCRVAAAATGRHTRCGWVRSRQRQWRAPRKAQMSPNMILCYRCSMLV
jgi:hypothetical protein